MSVAAADYARVYEREFRPERTLKRRVRRTAALVVWAGLFMVRPKLALEIWQGR